MSTVSYTPRPRTEYIAIHCAATKPSQDIGEAEIRQWHKDRGWSDVGYNVVIRRSGLIEIGRPLDWQGAHVAGYNDEAIGVCLVGGIDDDGKPANNFTTDQFVSLLACLRFLRRYAPDARIQGHRDFPGVLKDCPSFNVRAWLESVDPQLL
jgi:N-acetylmuramoyl-L-alanine amidase